MYRWVQDCIALGRRLVQANEEANVVALRQAEALERIADALETEDGWGLADTLDPAAHR